MDKKAQVTYMDFLIGLLVLIVITFIFVRTIVDLNFREDKFQGLINDGVEISNSLMSSGYCPSKNCLTDWKNINGRIGIVKDGKIMEKNFADFLTLLDKDYEKSKTLFGTKSDYVFYLAFNNAPITGIYGKYENLNDVKGVGNRIEINRFVYYGSGNEDGKIVKMVIIAL